MTDPQTQPVAAQTAPVRLRVGEHGAFVEWQLALTSTGLRFQRDRETTEVKDNDLSGVDIDAGVVALHSRAATTAYLQGDERVGAIAEALMERNCRVREVTRPLRALGARQGRPGKDHDHFFAPLLTARRQAQMATDHVGRLDAFDSGRLRDEFEKLLHTFATEKFPRSLPERRAFYEALNRLAEPLYDALGRANDASLLVRAGAARDRFVLWQSWLGAIDGIFTAADRCWLEMLPVLDEARNESPAFWRRFVRGDQTRRVR
jgi:hypothetical protein